MSLFKAKLLLTLILSLSFALPSLAVDEKTLSKLEELLERAKARKLGKKYSTRDLAKDKVQDEKDEKSTTSESKPSSYQPVINVNQNTEVNGSGSSQGQARSYEDILREYKAKREAQKEEVQEPKIEEKKIEQPKTPSPQVAKPVIKSVPVQKTEPQVKKVIETPVVEKKEAVKAPEPVKDYSRVEVETKNEVIPSPVSTTTDETESTTETKNSEIDVLNRATDVLDHSRSVTPGFTDHKTLADREADYQLVLRKSLKSLEEDAWNEVKYNMGEARDYFAREKAIYTSDKNLETYYKIIMAFQRFAEAGLELDQGDFADFDEAEALYLDAYEILDEVDETLGDDLNSKNIKDILNTVRGYIDEDLAYIEEMIGI